MEHVTPVDTRSFGSSLIANSLYYRVVFTHSTTGTHTLTTAHVHNNHFLYKGTHSRLSAGVAAHLHGVQLVFQQNGVPALDSMLELRFIDCHQLAMTQLFHAVR